MATAFTQSQKNIRKTWLLMFCFLLFFILIGWVFSHLYNDYYLLYFAIFFAFFGNFFSYFFSDKIALAVSGAKRADEKNQNHLKAIRAVENMSLAAVIERPKVYIVEDPAINAFATGRNEKKATIFFTTGLLENLDKLELEGVVAHEIAHIKNKDILLMSIVVVLVGFVAILSDLALRTFLFKNDNKNPAIAIMGLVLIVLSPVIAKIIQLAISRKREFLADATGAQITRHPESLANALEKISKQNLSVKKATTATAHLYIANPLKKNSKENGLKGGIFSTHPPVAKRVAALKKMSGLV